MKTMTLEHAVDYLEDAQILTTQDIGHALIHTGINAAGARFALVADLHGRAVVSEAL